MSGSSSANPDQRFVTGMTALRRIVVAGASQAGLASAAALRGFGFDGEIIMIGDENHRPYTRPPLSKGVLLGAESEESVFLDGTADDVTLRTSTRAVGLDCSSRLVTLEDGERVSSDGLIIATGVRARRVDSGAHRGEITLRTLDDAVAVRDRLVEAEHVSVVGGGFLGMEIASSAVKLHKVVTVVDQVRPLIAHLGPVLADMCLMAADDHSVKVRLADGGVELGFDGDLPRRVLGVDHTVIAEGDLVITAAGDVPNTEWLSGSGVRVEDGVLVDDCCRVAPGIVAAGEVVSAPASGNARGRRPHWWNALRQARIAAGTLLGCGTEATAGDSAVPFFWTEIFGLNIRIAGKLAPLGEPIVIEGSVADRRALLVWPANHEGFGTAVSVNFPISVAKLTRLANQPST
ncbi:NAD(P)/FAD-dependent oxidoreductase [Nocardia sp. CA-151230]|uniref:NAD(P)/FAD-dependent oxidoreductase n=1 Tax=Nocardia sp. CA-151230 TaxID=3239982 RepID=UPI003D92E2D2